jgi:sugar lactone lactonase YvrE
MAQVLALKHSTTWFGNTFGGGPNWVQNFAQGMSVDPDGNVYVASKWDEGGREFGIYRDGKIAGAIPDTHGWGTGGGRAIAASNSYIFIAHSQGNEGGGLKGEQYPPAGKTWYGVSRRNRDGSHAPFEGGRGRFKDMVVLHESETPRQVLGMATHGGKLFVSDTTQHEVKIFDAASMKSTGSFPVDFPQHIAADAQGNLWILHSAAMAPAMPTTHIEREQRISRFSPQGGRLGIEVPLHGGLARFGGIQGFCLAPGERMLIALGRGLGDPENRIEVVENINGEPRRAKNPRVPRTAKPTIGFDDNLYLGERGGMMSGPVPGKAGPWRFPNIVGVGVDRAGNLYVGCDQDGGGTVLRCFAPDGRGGWDKMKWELLGLEFVDGADATRSSDGTDVWTTENRYTLDWSKPVGKQWTWRAQTVDPARFPLDPRLHEGHHNISNPLLRTLNGKPFLIARGMFSQAIVFYKIEGEIAVPSAMIARHPYREVGWKKVEQPDGRWIWRDASGDGAPQKSEFVSDAKSDPEFWAQWVDERGGVWQGWQDKTPSSIKYLPLLGLDARGNPIYDRAKEQSWPMPDGMTHLLRLEYLPATDTLYLSGHTTERPKTGGEWGQVGTEVWRVDNWLKGNRAPTWRAVLPYGGEGEANRNIKSMCVEGDHFFAVEGRKAIVHVYSLKDGQEIGTMAPGPEVSKESGWIDFPDAIRAFKRKSGEYLVFVEEDWKGKIITYRWKPA